MYNRLHNYLTVNGFREGHSTEMVLLRRIIYITEGLDNKLTHLSPQEHCDETHHSCPRRMALATHTSMDNTQSWNVGLQDP